MRTLTLFALAVAATAALSADASAFGKKKRGGSSSGCCDGGYGSSGGGYGSSGAGYGAGASCCGGTAGGYAGYAPGAMGGQAATIQANDGQFYTMGADGSYYSASQPATLGGFTSQPSGNYRGMSRGYYPNQGVMPAGYNSGPGYAYPAGGVPPLAMPMPIRR